MQPLCYHICFYLRIFFSGRHRNEFKPFFALQNGHFLMVFLLRFIVRKYHSQELCVDAFCYARVLLLLPCEQVCWGRASSVSFYFPKRLVPSKLQICKTFAQVCTMDIGPYCSHFVTKVILERPCFHSIIAETKYSIPYISHLSSTDGNAVVWFPSELPCGVTKSKCHVYLTEISLLHCV